MAFGFARVNRDSRPEAASSGREADAAQPGGLPSPRDGADDGGAPFEFEHAHGDTCSCNLRGE